MKNFLRWLRALVNWGRSVPVAPHYWCSIILLSVVTAAAGMCGWSERSFRLWGMTLQIFGTLTVVWGIFKTRADFGQPTMRSKFQHWFTNFPSFRPRTNTASMNLVFPSAVFDARGYSTRGPSTDRTVEGRLDYLEKIMAELEIAQEKTNNAVFQAEKKAQQALDAYSVQFADVIANVSKKIETTATGGVHVSAMGIILLIVGTIFGTAAPEISNLLSSYQLLPLWKVELMPNDVNKYLTDYLAPASAALAAFVAYIAVYRNSQPQIVAYYQPSERQ